MTDTNVSLISYTAVSKYFGHSDIFSSNAANKKCKNISLEKIIWLHKVKNIIPCDHKKGYWISFLWFWGVYFDFADCSRGRPLTISFHPFNYLLL